MAQTTEVKNLKFSKDTLLPVVQLVSTGGTIAMKRDPDTNAPVPAISGEDLLSSVPGVSEIAAVEIINHSNLPSAYLGPEHWVTLTRVIEQTVARSDIVGVVISHGTDSLEETAFWLDLTVKSDKPIVLVGAQRNASEGDSDGPRNLLSAIQVAIAADSQGCGVLVVMNNQISSARDVVKTHTMNVESFNCVAAGFLGFVDPDRVIFSRKPIRRTHLPLIDKHMPLVEIVAMYGGCDGAAVVDAVERGAKGIVVQALGLGNVNLPTFAAIKAAMSAGVAVVISSRVPNGRVLPAYGFEGGGKTLWDGGAIFSDDLGAAKARILLMLLLQKGVSTQRGLQAAFDS